MYDEIRRLIDVYADAPPGPRTAPIPVFRRFSVTVAAEGLLADDSVATC